jgi:pSer/pThr/pTyr-binding forkhead associated (FHA) protein
MNDGRTRKVEIAESDESWEAFRSKWKASVVVLEGPAAGTEFVMESANVSIGRGDVATWMIDHDTLSREHAALELVDGRVRIRDLGSTNGCRVNGSEVKAADLKNGDRIQLGECGLQFVLEKSSRGPKTYVVDA